jgi:hypothetical protein
VPEVEARGAAVGVVVAAERPSPTPVHVDVDEAGQQRRARQIGPHVGGRPVAPGADREDAAVRDRHPHPGDRPTVDDGERVDEQFDVCGHQIPW